MMTASDPKVFKDHDLTRLNTMGVQAQCKYFAEVSNVEELKHVLREYPDEKLLVLGGGSNILFASYYDGLVIRNGIEGKRVIAEDDSYVRIQCGAGEDWHELVMWSIDQGWGGLENMALIPGSVGAAPIQNIGAYGKELESVFVELQAYDIATHDMRTIEADECEFGYRDSIFKGRFKGKFVITSVTLKLNKVPEVDLSYKALKQYLDDQGIKEPDQQDVARAVIAIRRSKLPDPAEIGNTGSFFKNPVVPEEDFEMLREQYPDIPFYIVEDGIKIPAAWMIDQCGWKGERRGDAGVHEKQALVLVNHGSATGQEILDLASEIKRSVKASFGIMLETEVNIIS